MDDDLRALEQRLRSAPSAEARLALSRGLERVGRRDEAHVVLAQDPFDVDVTAALASYPAWTHRRGDPGGARWLDVPPIERTPTVRWRTDLGLDPIDIFAVTPWGIVVGVYDDARYERVLVVLDPRNGAVRHLERVTADALGVERGVLLLTVHGSGAARTLVGFDLASLTDAWRLDLGANPSPTYAHGSILIGGDDAARPLAFVSLPDPRTPPALPAAWPEIGIAATTPARAYVTPQRRLHERRSFVVRHERGSIRGVEPWTGPVGVFHADAQGVVVTAVSRQTLVVLRTPDGAPLWDRPDLAFGHDVALGPTHLFVWARARQACVLRRDTGAPTTLLPETGTAAGARDWIYAGVVQTLVGARVDGGATWTLDLDVGDLLAVAPLWGRRAIVLGDAGAVACVEQA